MAEAVKVIVRCRPLNEREKKLKCDNVIEMDSKIGQCRLRKPNEKSQPPKGFTFDGVFNTDSITETIYNDICFPLVEGCVEGYNGTVFAYGQTGCGKSFSMQGIEDPPTQRGVIPRAFEHIFESIQVSENAKFLVHASYLEIYNEDIRDLLVKTPSKLEVKENPDRGVYVKDLSKVPCHNVEDMDKVMDRGSQNRSVGATLMNADSSRSHSIFTIYIETCEAGADGEEHIRAGKLNLVDLAGSERQAKTGATGDRLKEATKINLSLSALGNVISALVDGKSKHIPYRDSKLTRLLQDSLGGNTKTLMVACISPADNNYDETLSTLRYANRAKNIKNKPKINEDPKDALLREYHDEIQMLKKLLTGQLDMSPDLIAKLGLTGVTAAEPKPKPERPPPPDPADVVVAQETERIKKEYEAKLEVMQKKYDDEQLSKQKLAQEVEKLQQDLTNTLQDTSAKLDGFKEETAGAILADFQAKAAAASASEESSGKEALSKEISASNVPAPENEEVPHNASPSNEVIQRPKSGLDSPSSLRGYAAKGIGMLKNKLTGSNQNMAVSVSKQGADYSQPDIHVSENNEAPQHSSPKKVLTGAIGNVASAIQEEAVKRLTSLQEQLVGNEKQNDPKLEELKRKHKRRKDHASERQKKMIKEVQKWEGEGIMVKVYDNLQDEIKAKNERAAELETELQVASSEISDIQSEFQAERVDYLDSIRRLEKQIALQNSILNKIQPTIRRDCNYSNIDRMKVLSEYDEETEKWKIPDLTIERTSLPKAGPGKENLASMKQQSLGQEKSDYQERDNTDRFANHLQNTSSEEFSHNYFKPKRADKLLTSSGGSNGGLFTNNNSTPKTPSPGVLAPLPSEPARRPQKLEALPPSAFEKKKKKKNRDL